MDKYYKIELKIVGSPLQPVWVPIKASCEGGAILMMLAQSSKVAYIDFYCENIAEIKFEEYYQMLFKKRTMVIDK